MADTRDKLIHDILAEVAKVIKSGDDDKLRQLHARTTGRKSRSNYGTPGARKPATETDPSKLAEQFSQFVSRDKLEDYLIETYPAKLDVADLARSLRIPITKADSYESLANKIIDSTLGYRLRSQTIRGRTELPFAPDSTD